MKARFLSIYPTRKFFVSVENLLESILLHTSMHTLILVRKDVLSKKFLRVKWPSYFVSMKDAFACKTSKLLEKFEGYVTEKNSNIKAITSWYQKDFDSNRLSLHRRMFLDQITLKDVKIISLQDVANYLQVNGNLADLITESIKLLRLLLIIPASSCTAERSFCALRRLKNYIRSSMKANTLNHLSLIYVHSDLTKELLKNNQIEIITKFILQNQLRKSTFATL